MHAMIVMPIALAACAATMIGGVFAIGLRDRLHLVLGFSAGAVIGMAFFDLMPQALESGRTFYDPRILLGVTALGFFLYMLLDRVAAPHGHDSGHELRRAWIGAGSFSLHSLLDGFAIGIAFQASRAVGLVVAAAVLIHDFSDGLNTVNMVTKNGGDRRTAFKWLLVDAIAPVLGAAASLLVIFPAAMLAIVLAVFSGFFLYIGASDLLPESHHAHPRFFTSFATLLGALCIFAVVHVAG